MLRPRHRDRRQESHRRPGRSVARRGMESVKDARGRKLTLNTAMAESSEIAEALSAAPASPEPDNANAAIPVVIA